MKPTFLALLLPSLLATTLLTACTDDGTPDTPRSEIAAPLAGDWFTGSLSNFQYYDPDTGEWEDPNGEGFYFIFSPDGSYETGAVINSTVSGCTMRLLGQEVGTAVVDGDAITLYRHWIKTHVTNSCGDSGDNAQGEATTTVHWAIQPDENGLPWLSLTHDDGTIEQYRRWTE